ncbi:MAG: hypothetical protein QOI21_4399 [Actinomycetota bacterium]|nr:hypothetical protein [Actinomycetota bacterium]
MSRPDGSDSSPRVSVAPPREPQGLMQRAGFAVLAVSGVVVATAFAAIAELASPGAGIGASGTGPGGGQGTTPGIEVLQGSGVPGAPMTVPGSGAPADSTSATPTTVASTGADGKTTTSVLPPPAPGQPNVPIPPGTTIVPPRNDPPPPTTSKTTTSTSTSKPDPSPDPTDPTDPTTSTSTPTSSPAPPTTGT